MTTGLGLSAGRLLAARWLFLRADHAVGGRK